MAVDGFPSWPPNWEMLAFAGNRDGDFDVYVVRADGSELVQLTTEDARDIQPVFSPRGTRIAFGSDRDDSSGEVYTMNTDGTDVVCVTDSPGLDLPFSWRGRTS
jgi:TolB protein